LGVAAAAILFGGDDGGGAGGQAAIDAMDNQVVEVVVAEG
jgi:hypothetical protein